MFFIKTIRLLKKQLAESNERIMLLEAELHRMASDKTVTHYHCNAKMLAGDILKRALTREVNIEGFKTPVKYCLVSQNELKVIANSKIK